MKPGRLLAAWGACFTLLVLGLPLAQRVEAGVASLRFLAMFLSDGEHAAGSAGTRAPIREALTLATADRADLWRPRQRGPRPGLLLLHGLTPDGKDDPRLARAAEHLARGGFAVLVPDLPGMRAQRLRPDDARVVVAALTRLTLDPRVRPDQTVVVAVSVGVAPALAAAADPTVAARVRLVVSLGGYADARELIRYFTTGAYAFGDVSGRVSIDPALAREFLGLNLDLVRDSTDRDAVRAALGGRPLPRAAGPEAQTVLAVLGNRDPARADTLLAALPPETRALLDTLSPARDARRLRARLLLVHGRADPAVPFTESLRLAAAADPARSRLVLVDLVGHVEGHAPRAWQQASDFARLWSVAYEIFRG